MKVSRSVIKFCIKYHLVILKRTEKVMMRAMCGVKLIEKRRSQELMTYEFAGFKGYFG